MAQLHCALLLVSKAICKGVKMRSSNIIIFKKEMPRKQIQFLTSNKKYYHLLILLQWLK